MYFWITAADNKLLLFFIKNIDDQKEFCRFPCLPLFDHDLITKNTLAMLNSHLMGFTNDFVTFLTQSLGALGLCNKFECGFNPEQHMPWHFLI